MLAMVATVVHPKYTLNGTPTSHRSRQVNPAARSVLVMRIRQNGITTSSTADSG